MQLSSADRTYLVTGGRSGSVSGKGVAAAIVALGGNAVLVGRNTGSLAAAAEAISGSVRNYQAHVLESEVRREAGVLELTPRQYEKVPGQLHQVGDLRLIGHDEGGLADRVGAGWSFAGLSGAPATTTNSVAAAASSGLAYTGADTKALPGLGVRLVSRPAGATLTVLDDTCWAPGRNDARTPPVPNVTAPPHRRRVSTRRRRHRTPPRR